MTSTPTAIYFPDPTDPGFDETVPFDAPNGNSYLWNGYGWELVCEGEDGDFLKRYGDTVDDAEESVEYYWNKDVSFASDEELVLTSEWGIYADCPDEYGYVILNVNGTELFVFDDAVGMEFGNAYIQCYEGSGVFGSQAVAQVSGGFDGEVRITSREHISLGAYYSSKNQKIVWLHCDDNKGYYTGLIEDDESLVNKQYIDSKIINLQEEIETIAPTVQAGIWQDGNSASPGTGRFAMRLGNGSITQDYTDTTIVTLIVSTTDKSGGAHTFDKEEVGDEIQLFDVEDQNYGLFKIDAIDNSDPNYVQFTVTHLRGLGSTHVDDDVIVRTFKPVTSGDGTAYLLKNGETVTTGALSTFSWPDGVKITGPTDSYLQLWDDLDVTLRAGLQLNLRSTNGEINLTTKSGNEVNVNGLKVKAGGHPFLPDTIIMEDQPDNHVVDKKYVQSVLDFSQYDPLP